MRIMRNFALMLMLGLAPFAANWATAAEVGTTATCGDCTCDPGQCCSKSWTGGCECTTCPQAP